MTAASLLSSAPQFIGGRYKPRHIDVFSNQRAGSFHLFSEGSEATTTLPCADVNASSSTSINKTLLDQVILNNSKFDFLIGMCRCAARSTSDQIHSEVQSQLEVSRDDTSLYIFIAAGSVLKGMGHTPLHPLGISFIDDFAARRNSAFYVGENYLFASIVAI